MLITWVFSLIKYIIFSGRYSYFHKLLPLLMTGLSDELPDIQRQSKLLMNKVSIYVT